MSIAFRFCMAKKPRDQQQTDARRIARRGTGKLGASPDRPAQPRRPADADRRPSDDEVRERLLAERRAVTDGLARLGVTPERDEPAGTGDSPFEEGDVAQASERLDMGFLHRERLTARLKRLTRALERLARGQYGVCEECGRPIEAARLAAMPEATVCRDCQEQRERDHRAA